MKKKKNNKINQAKLETDMHKSNYSVSLSTNTGDHSLQAGRQAGRQARHGFRLVVEEVVWGGGEGVGPT